MPTDNELMTFDRSRLADFSEKRAATALAEHGELYRNHLAIARWIDAWIGRNMEGRSSQDAEFQEGYEKGFREIAAHLRQADLLPGGGLYTEIS